MSKQRILIVDDEQGVRRSLQAIFRDEGFEADAVPSGEECLKVLGRKAYDLILLDVWLPGMDGLETLTRLRQNGPAPSVVMISGHGTIETAVRATKLGAFDFIEKPLSLEKTVLVVRNALQQRRLEEENRSLREQISRADLMIGESVPMKALRQQIDYAAPTDGRVLIYGENGTGKELVARLLHQKSLRRDRRFVEINCAAIPDDLIESELFGHVKGAFTGATEDKKGKLEEADGGTLFLDEVGDMSLKTQSKVLRVLEEHRFEPLGSNVPVHVDVRVLAATNKDLAGEMEKGRFREDLFYRLNVIPFQVPPLRERKEDIPLLVDYFVDDFCRKYGRKPKRFTERALEALRAYPWPGNVRELKNIVERLVIMLPAPRLDWTDLPPSVLQVPPASVPGQQLDSLEEAQAAFERAYLLARLCEQGWNISRTAEVLRIDRSNLHRKMKAYGIAPPRSES